MNLTEFRNSSQSNSPHFVLLGNPVGHSLSPLMHNAALNHYRFNARYHAIALQNRELSDLATYLNESNLLGANVTIPYKQVITDYLDIIGSSSRKIGAINTIVKDGYQLRGANTDYEGFLAPLGEYEYELEGTSALVFGTGGASRAIIVALNDIGLETIYVVSRTPDRTNSFFSNHNKARVVSYSNWTSFLDEVYLIVNATPLGMYPNIGQSPVRNEEVNYLADRICYDIVYNPIRTTFLKQAQKAGAKTINGLEMLIQQGSKSFKLWTGRPFPVEKIKDLLDEKFGD